MTFSKVLKPITIFAVMALVILTAAILLPINGEAGGGISRFFGRFHVLILHLPVTLLLIAPLLSLLTRLKLLPPTHAAIRLIWWLGSVSAFTTVVLGLLLAANEGYNIQDIRSHMLGGITVALLAFSATLIFENKQNKPSLSVLYGLISTTLIFAIFIAAHAGGNLVHGDSYLTRFAPEPIASLVKKQTVVSRRQDSNFNDQIFNQKVKPLLSKYCFDCHGADIQKGGIQLNELNPDFANGHDAPNWHAALDMINTGEMPPKKKLQPTDEERRILVGWLTDGIQLAKEVKKGDSRQVIRRLTKQQYSNSLKDLLQLDIDFGSELPDDPLSHMGFSNSGELLQSSTLHLEKFESIARKALTKAIDPEHKPQVHRYRMNYGLGKGQNEPYSTSQGYLDVPIAPTNFYVDMLGSASQELDEAEFNAIKPYFSASMRGSYKKHFKIQQNGVDLFSATPHKESAESGKPGFWNAPSPNLSMQIKDQYPLTGDFRVKIKASKSKVFEVALPGVAASENLATLTSLNEKLQPLLTTEQNASAEAKDNFAVEGFLADKNNPELLRPINSDGKKNIHLALKLPEEKPSFYQIDLVYEGTDKASEFDILIDYKHKSSIHLPASTKNTIGKLQTKNIGVAYLDGIKHSVVISSTKHVPAFTDVVFTKVNSESNAAKKMPVEIVSNPVNDAQSPMLMPYIGTRMDDGVDYNLLSDGILVTSTEPTVFEFSGRLENFPIPGHGNKGDNITSSSLKIGAWNDDKVKSDTQQGSALNIEYIEFEAPYIESWPSKRHQNIFIESEFRENNTEYAELVIANFANKAFRRPISNQELQPYFELYQQVAPEFSRFEDGIKEVLVAILCSTNFLYLAEPLPINNNMLQTASIDQQPNVMSRLSEIVGIFEANAADSQPTSISEYALANRLSYFIWNSPPDDELLELAEQGQLRAQLPQQLSRMLKDSNKLHRFVSVFAKEWLRLERQQMQNVDVDKFPDYTRFVKHDMAQETILFIQTLIQEDLSALNLIDSDFALLNQNLAEFYGIEGVKGTEFRKFSLTLNQPRGGLLGQGAFLTGHADGVHSHPVKRAVWLKSKILGDEPPPPPPNVPDLDPETPGFEKLTLKQQLELHRDKESCRDCHAKIDPFGIVFENFDAVGRFRSKYKGTLVDSLTLLPDGTEVNGLNEIKTYLLKQQSDTVMLSVIKHLYGYALGKEISFHDETALMQILQQVKDADHSMQEMLLAIITSPAFNQI